MLFTFCTVQFEFQKKVFTYVVEFRLNKRQSLARSSLFFTLCINKYRIKCLVFPFEEGTRAYIHKFK